VAQLALVATPIGNLEDITLRALRVLREASLILAEDTRHSRTLLTHYGIATRPRSLHAHNEAERIEAVLEVLDSGGDVALVSDAGTPLVSDPGERLVAAVIEAEHDVTPIPGPSAVLAGLSVAGLPLEAGFSFVGFLPRKAGARDARIDTLLERSETLVFFESPKRIAATLALLAQRLGADRRACVARELTKLHEEALRGTLGELALRLADGARGEICLVVEGAPQRGVDQATLDAAIRAELSAGTSARDTAAAVADAHGTRKSRVYSRVLELMRARR
jgi:16S rRNA (cytidine1402-2'-O)-methyltransferase